MKELLAILNKKFPNMEATIVFTRDPKTKQLSVSPLFKLPENNQQEFLLAQSEKFQEYARGLSHLANTFHKVEFKK